MQKHHFSVDVEEYFQVSALAARVPRSAWDELPRRARSSTERLLELLEEYDVPATFFILGWLAKRESGLVGAIVAAGHEVACHGWGHGKVTDLRPDVFRESVRRSKALLEDLACRPVVGYRAPSFSITRGLEWALDILIEEGFTYDSSLFPVRRRGYGYAGGERDAHMIRRAGGLIAELPPTTLRIAGMQLPAAGGAYFRLLPASLTRAALQQAAARGVAGMVYIHPWELDPDQPRLASSPLLRFRHYGGLHRTEERLRRLFSEFRFKPLIDTVHSLSHVPA